MRILNKKLTSFDLILYVVIYFGFGTISDAFVDKEVNIRGLIISGNENEFAYWLFLSVFVVFYIVLIVGAISFDFSRGKFSFSNKSCEKG